MADPLLALSLLQPWLWAILERHKGFTVDGAFYAIENRTWRPAPQMIGRRFALHASAGYDAEGSESIDDLLWLGGVHAESPPKAQCARGAILGTARLVGAVAVSKPFVGPTVLRERFRIDEALVAPTVASGWTFGPWALVLGEVTKLPEPVPCKGALGFWRVPDHVAERVRIDAARSAA